MKRSNILLTAAFSLCLSLSAQANLTSEAMDFVRVSLTSTKKEALAQAPEQLRKSSAAYSQIAKRYGGKSAINQVDSLILLKKPIYKGAKSSPGIIMRKGLYQDHNNAAEIIWIGVVLPDQALTKLETKFAQVFEKAIQENPMFDIDFVTYTKRMYGFGGNSIVGNVNHTHLDVMVANIESVIISGKEMTIVNIPISKTDNVEDVLELINILDKKIELAF